MAPDRGDRPHPHVGARRAGPGTGRRSSNWTAPPGAPADVLLNGRLIAHGEVVVVDQDYAVRITRILDVAEGARLNGRPHPRPAGRSVAGRGRGVLWYRPAPGQRHRSGRARASRSPSSARRGIGQKASVVVVDTGGKRFLLGVTEHSVNVLHTDDAPVPDPAQAAEAGSAGRSPKPCPAGAVPGGPSSPARRRSRIRRRPAPPGGSILSAEHVEAGRHGGPEGTARVSAHRPGIAGREESLVLVPLAVLAAAALPADLFLGRPCSHRSDPIPPSAPGRHRPIPPAAAARRYRPSPSTAPTATRPSRDRHPARASRCSRSPRRCC